MIATSILHGEVIRPLQTLANMVAAIREEDFFFRLRGAAREDSLADLIYEINTLATRLQKQKISALEATALLKKVMMEIDVAVFTFDQQQRLRIVNRAGEQLMGRIAPRMLGLTAEELGLHEFLQSAEAQTVQMTFPGKHGRWAVSHTSFRENGIPHQLLLISDLSRALREEERQAWQRLIRVLGHELNNSLAPIKSIAGTLGSLTGRSGLPEETKQDMQHGLKVIENRVESLGRFMQVYTQLARMPAPTRSRIEVGALVERVAALERRLPVKVLEGPPIMIEADPDQLEQVVINLIRNAVDASLEASPKHPGTGGSRLEDKCARGRNLHPRRRSGAAEQRQSLCTVFYHQAWWQRDWAHAEPADCRGPWRSASTCQSARPYWLRSHDRAPYGLPISTRLGCKRANGLSCC